MYRVCSTSKFVEDGCGLSVYTCLASCFDPCRCWLLTLLVKFFLAADERFTSPCTGGYFTARGWSRKNKILGNKFYFNFVIIAFFNLYT